MTKDYNLEVLLKEYFEIDSLKLTPITGGDTNRAFKVDCQNQSYFVKVNYTTGANEMFDKEVLALKHMATVMTFAPIPIKLLDSQEFSCLILPFIETSSSNETTAHINLARNLTKLHSNTHELFGYDQDNFIGTLNQVNSQMDSWPEFYVVNRLDVQVKLAYENGLLYEKDLIHFQHLYKELGSLLDHKAKASLLHGDLWNGNYMIDLQNNAWLIDPAIYYGDHEVDLAMTKLFGGFSNDFYEAYKQFFPLQPGYRDRLPYYQLYYLLVHLNLFGANYYRSIKETIVKH